MSIKKADLLVGHTYTFCDISHRKTYWPGQKVTLHRSNTVFPNDPFYKNVEGSIGDKVTLVGMPYMLNNLNLVTVIFCPQDKTNPEYGKALYMYYSEFLYGVNK